MKSCGVGVCSESEKGISHSLTWFLISLPITTFLRWLSSGKCSHDRVQQAIPESFSNYCLPLSLWTLRETHKC